MMLIVVAVMLWQVCRVMSDNPAAFCAFYSRGAPALTTPGRLLYGLCGLSASGDHFTMIRK